MSSGAKILFLLSSLYFAACSSKKSDSAAAPATDPTLDSIPGTGTLSIKVEPKEGAPEESAAGANVVVYGNSELAAVADESGQVTLPNVPPGTISIVVTSEDGSTLQLKGSEFGLKVILKMSAPNLDSYREHLWEWNKLMEPGEVVTAFPSAKPAFYFAIEAGDVATLEKLGQRLENETSVILR